MKILNKIIYCNVIFILLKYRCFGGSFLLQGLKGSTKEHVTRSFLPLLTALKLPLTLHNLLMLMSKYNKKQWLLTKTRRSLWQAYFVDPFKPWRKRINFPKPCFYENENNVPINYFFQNLHFSLFLVAFS